MIYCILKKILSCLFLIFLSVFISQELPGSAKKFRIYTINNKEYLSLYEMCDTAGFDQSIDPVLGRGKIYSGKKITVYQTGLPAILSGNEIIKSDYPVERSKKGEIFMPADSGRRILEIMLNKVFERSGSYYEENTDKTPQSVVIEKPEKHYEHIDFIVIDAGHGGKDPGALGKGGKREKDITLSVCKKIESVLRKKLNGTSIKLTRTKDVFLELGERTEVANKLLGKSRNGIFISVHVNASVSPKSSGFETYFLSRDPTSDDARVTATMENNVVVLETRKKHKYDDVEFVEALMLTAQIQQESGFLAEKIQTNMASRMTESESRGVKRADFFVLRGSLMPAVLVEIGYITNKKELNLLITDRYQSKAAEAVADGVLSFISDFNKLSK